MVNAVIQTGIYREVLAFLHPLDKLAYDLIFIVPFRAAQHRDEIGRANLGPFSWGAFLGGFSCGEPLPKLNGRDLSAFTNDPIRLDDSV